MSLLDQRVQIDHLLMVVEEVDDHLPSDVRRQRRNRCKHCAFRHPGVVGGRSFAENKQLYFFWSTKDI